MTLTLTLLADAGLLAVLAYLGTVLARLVTAGARSFADGPPPGRPAIGIMIGAAALAGLCIGARGVALPELGMACVLTVALSGICYADVRYGLVPDVFTLGPLGAVLAGDALLHHWSAAAAAALVAGPFGIAARASRGRGMGWGDVKLVALGAAVLGAQPALLAFAVACFAAVALAAARGRRAAPIAFAPYLVAGIAVAGAAHGVA
jgi:prepilin signal peptidase PulO-like enzyme (type II secretory pathway)